jgi:predicted nucleotidyltransferase
MEMDYLQLVLMFPYNSWEFADIALTKGISTVPTGSYNYDERRLSYFARGRT